MSNDIKVDILREEIGHLTNQGRRMEQSIAGRERTIDQLINELFDVLGERFPDDDQAFNLTAKVKLLRDRNAKAREDLQDLCAQLGKLRRDLGEAHRNQRGNRRRKAAKPTAAPEPQGFTGGPCDATDAGPKDNTPSIFFRGPVYESERKVNTDLAERTLADA